MLQSTLISEPSSAAAARTVTRAEWWAHARHIGPGGGSQPQQGAIGAHQLHFDVDETRLRKVWG